MHENVWEWVHDRYGTYDSSAPVTDPLGTVYGSSGLTTRSKPNREKCLVSKV